MKQFIRLTLILGFVSAIAAGALAVTYEKTKDNIKIQEKKVKLDALSGVFFNLEGEIDARPVIEGDDRVLGIYLNKEDKKPSYYAVEGQAIGYNASVPIQLLVGFTATDGNSKALLKGYSEKEPAKNGTYVVGWQVIKSEETPGLGEKAKDSRPPYTWTQKVTGTAPKEPGKDNRTDFQKQFAGMTAGEMESKKTVDVITAATYSTNGIIESIRNAEANLSEALNKSARISTDNKESLDLE